MAQEGQETQPGQDLNEKVKKLEDELEALKLRLELQEKSREEERVKPPAPLNILNPRITVFGNFLGRLDDRPVLTDDGDEIDDTMNMREFEVDFRAAVDPYADGLLILTAEAEVPGEFEVAVEEGYVKLKRIPLLMEDPPMGMNWKVGRFRTEFGSLNTIHLHDLPQSDRPLVQQFLLGEEGQIGDGLSLYVTPGTFTGVTFDGVLQAYHDGEDFQYLANLGTFSELFNPDHTLRVAGVANHRASDNAKTYSVDALYRWRPARGGQFKSLLLGGQAFYQENPDTSPFGYFAFAQYQIDQPWYVGVRWDWAEDAADERIETSRATPYVSWYLSEFLRMRVSYEHTWSDDDAMDGLDTFLFELNFVFGSHPAEPFWVNK